MPHPVRRRTLLLAGAAWPLGVRAGVQVEPPAWKPSRPVRLLVAYPPGGISDQVARLLAQRLAAQLQVPVRVENRPGAGGALAMDLLARSRPDGHTLGLAAITAIALLRKAGSPPGAPPPVTPVAALMRTPVLVVGTPALRAQSVQDMVAEARRAAGAVRWASTGEGTTGHRVLQAVQRASGAAFVHVPYQGGGQQVADALAGHFEVLSTNVAAQQVAAVRAGRLKALAVGAPARLAVLPQVPTLAEAGFPEANRSSLFGVFAPPDLPAERLARLNAEINSALAHPHMQSRLLAMNNLPVGGSPGEFAESIRREAAP